jgi:hypothetical protein
MDYAAKAAQGRRTPYWLRLGSVRERGFVRIGERKAAMSFWGGRGFTETRTLSKAKGCGTQLPPWRGNGLGGADLLGSLLWLHL